METKINSVNSLNCIKDEERTYSQFSEPFDAGRSSGRLIFDFGVMMSLLSNETSQYPVLDFGSGTGWVSEFCARMGIQVVAFDIHDDLQLYLEGRCNADMRIDPNLISYKQGDGHNMPFDSNVFGSILCYDTLHHMHSFDVVFKEFYRVLAPGGRAIFVEPGARHSTSPETIAFVETYKKDDPDWIERDIVLEDIDVISKLSGFSDGLRVIPVPHPLALQKYTMQKWSEFRKGDATQRKLFDDQLASLNYFDRVIFYVEKPR